MSQDAFEKAALAIPYQYRHPKLLHGLIRWLEPEVCVEIGTHIGMSAVWMARALQLNGHGRLYTIDPWCWVNETQEEQWESNLRACGVRDLVTHIRGRSQEVQWPEKVDFAFIDGNHTFAVCKHDVEKAVSLGASLIAIHDTVSWEGSRLYAEKIRYDKSYHDDGMTPEPGEHCWAYWDIFEAEFDCGITILKKRFPKGPCEGKDVGEFWDVSTGGVNAAP